MAMGKRRTKRLSEFLDFCDELPAHRVFRRRVLPDAAGKLLPRAAGMFLQPGCRIAGTEMQ